MSNLNRRTFLQTASSAVLGAAGLAAVRHLAQAAEPGRKFTMDLRCGSIGVQANLREAIRLAGMYGFESVEPSAGELANASSEELQEILDALKASHLAWGAAGLPVNFRADEEAFRKGVEQLPQMAEALQRAGVGRVSTWITPGHNELTYLANLRQHARRLGEVAAILADRGVRLGLEYVGPKTSWTKFRFPFVHTMAEAKDLIAEIDRDNVGLVLDSWHWYTAGETEADLLTLTNADVVACDLNDAPAGIPVDQQQDLSRELPAATGVIDLKTFLGALVKIGYDGPVRAEPFNQPLNALDNEPAVAATAAAMKKAFARIP